MKSNSLNWYSRYRSIPFLRKGINQSGGRNNIGKITVRHRGGGHKQAYRFLDWNRQDFSKKKIVVGFEYDPQRNASLAKLYHLPQPSSISNKSIDQTKTAYSYILAPTGIKLFQEIFTHSNDKIIENKNKQNTQSNLLQAGDAAPISFYEPGDFIHAVEAYPGQGAVFARSSGTFCQIISITQIGAHFQTETNTQNSNRWAKVRLPSGSQRLISFNARATYGIVDFGNSTSFINLKKAGRSRWLGKRPSVRGVARNPVDHPHGGGQGKTSGGRPSVTFKAWPTKGQPTRSPKRKNSLILTSHKDK